MKKSYLMPILASPSCSTAKAVEFNDQYIKFDNERFPVIDGVPILINEKASIFRLEDFESRNSLTTFRATQNKLKGFFVAPDMTFVVHDFGAEWAIDYCKTSSPDPLILVIGAGDANYSAGDPALKIIYSDVALRSVTDVVADGHDLPFLSGVFDLVILVAVLEHVVDPQRVVSEATRVLKDGGYIYADTPFMQQVHLGRYDFTRFSRIGHRLLFRRFESIQEGVSVGPASAFVWALNYFLGSFAKTTKTYWRLRSIARWIGVPFLAFAKYTAKNPGAHDCAGAHYFFGRLDDKERSVLDLISAYQGFH